MWMYENQIKSNMLLKSFDRDREGGYCRILKTTRRLGDNAEMAVIEYIDRYVDNPSTTD